MAKKKKLHTTSSSQSSSIVITRGMRRKQARHNRCRERVPEDALIVSVDLAYENQAVCFMHHREVLGRIREKRPLTDFAPIFEAADKLCRTYQIEKQVWAMEPAGHYWMLLAEQCERRGRPYVLVHPLSVARQRETVHYNREKVDPRDAELIGTLASEAVITETVLPRTKPQAALQDLAHAYFKARHLSAAARAALSNFWHRLLPEFFDVISDISCLTAMAIANALMPFSKIANVTKGQWIEQVKEQEPERQIRKKAVGRIYDLIIAVASDPHRRAGEGMPWRIRQAAERRRLFEAQKQHLREIIFEHYRATEEAIYIDSIEGSDPFYNALTLALIGDLKAYDDPRAIVKLAGLDVNQFQSGAMKGKSRISHRGRNQLRAAAYLQATYLVKRNPDLKQRFFYLKQNKKFNDRQAYVAIANSYLRTLHALVTTKQFYKGSQQNQ